MYEEFFRFDERPFPSAPRVELYFPASSAENAHQTLTRCIGRAEGPGLLIGGPGTGKSLLCHLLAARFRDAFHVVMLTSARLCTRRALLQNILFELGLPYRGLEEGELRLSLIDFLKLEESNREGVLLLVDEAHTLPLRLVEEIRMITNSLHDGQPSVRLVLVGGPALEERLANPRLESLNQRIAGRCYLQPLSYDETFEYVRSQIVTVGGVPAQVFTEDALAAVHQATDAVPRLINQLCDHALVLAVVNEQQQVDARLIEEAWADLQQLPAPQQEPSTNAFGAEGVIEFGALDEPDFGELEDEAPATPEPIAESDEIDLTRHLNEIEACVAQVEQQEPSACEVENNEEPTDYAHSELESMLGIEMPIEPEPEFPSAIEPVAEFPSAIEPEPEVPSAVEPLDEVRAAIERIEELSVPKTDNPFEESFDDEEIVVDHYSQLHAASQSVVPATSDNQERELTAAAEAILQGVEHEPAAEEWQDESAAVEPAENTDTMIPDVATFNEEIVQADRAFEEPAQEVVETAEHDFSDTVDQIDDMDESPSVQPSVMRVPPPDDSDLIVVVDDELDSGPVTGEPGAQRQDYRRLFSKLRQI